MPSSSREMPTSYLLCFLLFMRRKAVEQQDQERKHFPEEGECVHLVRLFVAQEGGGGDGAKDVVEVAEELLVGRSGVVMM